MVFKFNYGEYIFQQLLATEFVRDRLVNILISIAAAIINLHLVTVLCMITTINPYADFWLHISISVIASLNVHRIHNFLQYYHTDFYRLTLYLVNNYSIENYLYWKRIVVLVGCVYACGLLLTTSITNWILFVYIVQYAISFVVIEQFEQRRVQRWLADYREKPVINKHATHDLTLINSYMSGTIGSGSIINGPTREHLWQRRRKNNLWRYN